jgi:hypothetical protein
MMIDDEGRLTGCAVQAPDFSYGAACVPRLALTAIERRMFAKSAATGAVRPMDGTSLR